MKWIVLNLRAFKKAKKPIPVHLNTWIILKIIIDYYRKYNKPMPVKLLSGKENYMQYINKLYAYKMISKTKIGKYIYVTPTSAGIKRIEGYTYKDLVMNEYKKLKALGYERGIKYIETRFNPINVIV